MKLSKPSAPVVEITISNRTVVRVLLLVVATTLGLAALKQAAHALTLIFIAFFLALALNPPVHAIAQRLPGKRRGSRTLATALSALLIVVILGAFLASIVPPIMKQTSTFVSSTPRLASELRKSDSPVGRFIDRYNLEPQIEKATDDLTGRLRGISGAAFSTISRFGTSLFAALTVLALTFMMLIEGPRWFDRFKKLVPNGRRRHFETLAVRMYKVVKGYVNGQVTLAALAAILILPVLVILHVPYPFALMFVVFICGLIPMIGHTIGAVIVTLVALTASPVSAVIVLGYYILYQQIENYVIQPRIQANSTQMSPLLVFIAVVVGVSFSGLLGGLVAIPIMGCIRVSVLYWLEVREKQRAIAPHNTLSRN